MAMKLFSFFLIKIFFFYFSHLASWLVATCYRANGLFGQLVRFGLFIDSQFLIGEICCLGQLGVSSYTGIFLSKTESKIKTLKLFFFLLNHSTILKVIWNHVTRSRQKKQHIFLNKWKKKFEEKIFIFFCYFSKYKFKTKLVTHGIVWNIHKIKRTTTIKYQGNLI